MSGMQRSAKAAVLGAGPVGLCILLACHAAGLSTTYVTDLLEERLEIAHRCGAAWTGNPQRIDIVAAIEQHEPQGLDCVFECAGAQQTLDQAVEILKPGGTLLIVGIPEQDRVTFHIHTLRRKEIQVRNVRRQNHCMRPAIEMISSRRVNVDQLVTHRVSLADAKQAFDLVADYRDGVIKAMIEVSSQS